MDDEITWLCRDPGVVEEPVFRVDVYVTSIGDSLSFWRGFDCITISDMWEGSMYIVDFWVFNRAESLTCSA